jgi:hypothetical protein
MYTSGVRTTFRRIPAILYTSLAVIFIRDNLIIAHADPFTHTHSNYDRPTDWAVNSSETEQSW